MHPPEVITHWSRCNQCGESTPIPSDALKEGGPEPRYCMYCGAVQTGTVYGYG